MKKNVNRIIGVMLALVMVVGMLPAMAFAASIEVDAAPMVDNATMTDVAPADYSVSVSGATITVTATNVPKHQNGEGTDGYWVGIGIKLDPNPLHVTINGHDYTLDTPDYSRGGVDYVSIYYNAANYVDGTTPTITIEGTEYTVDFSAATPADRTTTVLSVLETAESTIALAEAAEKSTVVLSAEVKDNNGSAVTTGNVYFYADGVLIQTAPVGSKISYNLPALNDAPKTVVFTAHYNGATGAKEYLASDSADASVALTPITIKNGGVALIATPEFVAGSPSELSLDTTAGTVKDSEGNDVADTGYTVTYYVNTGDGAWTEVANPVTPAAGYTYIARVTPNAPYTEGAFEVGPIGNISANDTVTTVAQTVAGDIYEGSPVNFTAEVTPAAGGTVKFFYEFEGDGSKIYDGEVPLSAGKAVYTFTFAKAGEYTVYAEYSGNDAYNPSSANTDTTTGERTVIVLSTTIDATAAITPDALDVGKANTLTLTVTPGTGAPSYVEGTDYIVSWQSRSSEDSAWQEFTTGGATVSVTPASNKMQYRAVLVPTGNYVKPAAGIASNVARASNLAGTETTLTVTPAETIEGTSISLKASVKATDASVTDKPTGTVAIYKYVDGTADELVGNVDLNGAAEAITTATAPEYDGNPVYYYAVYSGNATFDASGAVSNDPTETFVAELTVNSDKIVTDGNSTTITVTPDEDPLVSNKTYTLAIPTVYQQDKTVPLTNGTDYTVEWQVSVNGGSTWTPISNTEDVISVTPLSKDHSYRAIITPKGDYKAAYNGSAVVDKIVLDVVNSTVINTYVVLTVTDTAGVYGTETIESEYEGEEITLTAVVKDDNGDLVTTGYVYFYRNGVQIGQTPVDVADGKAELKVNMKNWISGTQESETFTAEFKANDTYGPSVTDGTGSNGNPVEIGIRSTKLDIPVITDDYDGADTSSAAIEGLPAGTAITFALSGDVKALDGRTVDPADGFTYQWEQNSNSGMFVAISGATEASYAIASGVDKDSFRLTLVPTGHMTVGATSLTATIGALADPAVTLTATDTFDASAASFHSSVDAADKISGSHYGDEVTLSVTVKGDSVTPSGFVQFFYQKDGGAETMIGEEQELKSTSAAHTVKASVTTTELPQGRLVIFVKYLGDTTFRPEDTLGTNVDATAQRDFKVWSVQISNDSAKYGELTISVDPDEATLTADEQYTLTLNGGEPVYTEDGEELTINSNYTVEWQESTNGVDWAKVSGTASTAAATVRPATAKYQYRAKVTTTTDLFKKPLDDKRLDTEYTGLVVGSQVQGVTMALSTNKTDPAPYADAVYEGNDITLNAEIKPTAPDSTKPVTGKVKFFYSVDSGATWTEIESNDAMPVKEIEVKEYDGKYYAVMTTDDLPANAGKMQGVLIKAEYSGDETYDAMTQDGLTVTVYSSTVFAMDDVQNKVLTDPASESTAGIIIYAPEDILVSDGASTVLTLKKIYTLDAQDGTDAKILDTIGEYAVLTENVNYTVEWQKTESLNKVDPASSPWTKLDGVGHQVVVEPGAGFAYRAVITVVNGEKSDDTAKPSKGRTFMSETVYYSNVLVAAEAEPVLQLRAVPASSGAFNDTEIVFEAFVAGGTNIPTGSIQLTVKNSAGETVVDRTVSTVNGQVTFGSATFGDTSGAITLPADVYTVEAKYTGNNGYESLATIKTYVVRYKTEEIEVSLSETDYEGLIYNGSAQRPDLATVTFNGGEGHTAAKTLAAESIVFSYEMADASGEFKPIDYPSDAGTYRVTATLPQSIYYEAQTSEPIEFTIAQREVSVSEILTAAKVYNGATDVTVLDVELAFASGGDDGVIPGDSVYAVGTAVLETADALAANNVTFTAESLAGPDAANYVLSDIGSELTKPFTIRRNQIVVDSSDLTGSDLTGLKVYENYGSELAKGNGYTVRFFYHDGTGVKETTSLNKDGKYTVIIAPKDTANYKGGETFIMKVASGAVTFEENDAAAEAVPAVIVFSDTMQELDLTAGNTVAKSVDSATVTNETVTGAGRYPITGEAAGAEPAYGVFRVYKTEAEHVVPVVESKVYDGTQVTVANAADYPAGTYFAYTGGEIVGVSYGAPKDVGVYTVTAHVPATADTVAYSETSTFEITQKDITVSVVSVEKQVYRTNPYFMVTYSGLCDGDSDIKDMLVLPSFELEGRDGNANVDLNSVGTFTIHAFGVLSRNYNVTAYYDNTLAVKAEDPATTMTIVGLPQGQVYFGDTFQVAVYGTAGKRVLNDETASNQSSVFEYLVKDADQPEFASETPNVAIDEYGVVTFKTTGAAKDFTIRVTRGTGDYKIYAEALVSVKKRPVVISMKAADVKVYNAADQAVDLADYVVRGTVGGDVIDPSAVTYSPDKAKDVGEYLIDASYEDGKYVGVGLGLMEITPFVATVTSNDPADVNYGDAVVIAAGEYTDTALGSDTLLTAPETQSFVERTILNNSDVGEYEVFTAGTENTNYVVTYVSGTVAIVPVTLEVMAGVDDTTANFTITAQTEREYGEENPVLGYEDANIGLVAGDSYADLLIASDFVTYERVQEDDANLAGDLSGYVNDHTATDGYGKITIDPGITNINADAKNYDLITLTDGVLDIYQKNITVTVKDLTVLTGTELTDESYSVEVDRVLTERPMSDTIADLGLTFTPVGTAGTDPCLDLADIEVTLKVGTADDPQNYFRVNDTQTGVLHVTDKAATANITADKDSVTVETRSDVIKNEYVQLYVINASGEYEAVEGKFIVNPETVTDADENGYSDVRVDTGTAIYDADGNPTGETVLATEDFFVKVAEVEETKNDFVNVGDIEYTVLDANGNVVARGVLEADPANPGRYEDDPYDTIEGGLTELPKGTYTIVLNPLGGVYALVPTEKTFTVGSTPTPTPGPDPDPTPTPPTPTLIKDDHFAYMVGSGGAFRPTDNLTRAEAAQVLYNLLTDKTMGDRDVTFSDVTEERWFYTAVMTLASHGIIRGYSDGTFRPNAYITRAEFATLCSRFDDLTDGDMTFSDVPETHWAYKYIVSAASKGWITGYSDGTFRPDNNILRGEVVALLNRVLERYPDKEFIDAHEAELRSFSDVSKSYWNYYGIMEAANGHNYTKEDKEETWISLK